MQGDAREVVVSGMAKLMVPRRREIGGEGGLAAGRNVVLVVKAWHLHLSVDEGDAEVRMDG